MVVVLVLNTGCATIFNGSYQEVTFKSEYEADVWSNMEKIGTTNQPILIKRSELDNLYRVSKEGCVTTELELPLKTTWGYWVNLPFVAVAIGLLPAYIDAAYDNHIATEKEIEVKLDCGK